MRGVHSAGGICRAFCSDATRPHPTAPQRIPSPPHPHPNSPTPPACTAPPVPPTPPQPPPTPVSDRPVPPHDTPTPTPAFQPIPPDPSQSQSIPKPNRACSTLTTVSLTALARKLLEHLASPSWGSYCCPYITAFTVSLLHRPPPFAIASRESRVSRVSRASGRERLMVWYTC